MEELGTPPNSANAAVCAVELVFRRVIVKEDAIHACVLSKVNTTLLTCRTAGLPCLTEATNKLLYCLAV